MARKALAGRVEILENICNSMEMRSRCGHATLTINIAQDGYVDSDATCRKCRKIISRKDILKFRPFSARRIFNLFTEGK